MQNQIKQKEINKQYTHAHTHNIVIELFLIYCFFLKKKFFQEKKKDFLKQEGNFFTRGSRRQ